MCCRGFIVSELLRGVVSREGFLELSCLLLITIVLRYLCVLNVNGVILACEIVLVWGGWGL